MKKIIIKLGAFIILSIILSANLQAFAAAVDCTEDPRTPIDAINNQHSKSIGGTQCIKVSDKKDTEGNPKIITIVEEPWGTDIKKPDGSFESRTCFRNTIICELKDSEGKKEKVSAAEVLETCVVTPEQGGICNEVMVLISKAGTSMIEGYISLIYTWAAGFVGLIAVAVIIISSMQISMSGGDSQAVENSKARILKSLAGLAVLFLSGLILYTINPNFFVK